MKLGFIGPNYGLANGYQFGTRRSSITRYDYWSGRGRTALAGAVNVETARQVTEFADIIFIMVPDTPQVEEVLFGEHGCAKTSLQEKPSSI